MKNTKVTTVLAITIAIVSFQLSAQTLIVPGPDIILGTDDGRPVGEKTQQRALVHGIEDELFINYNGDFEGGTIINSDLTVTGLSLRHQGWDFQLGLNDTRPIGDKPLQRALVHWVNDQLILNFNGDFEGGTRIQSKLFVTDNASVNGQIQAKSIKVTNTPTADFVFEKEYQLPKLSTVEKFINDNKHLPEIQSAKDMTENGVIIEAFQIKLLQKIEELTLYTIQQDKQIKALKARLDHQE